jgi:MerR family transcriptional regulator, redox-sensitive transcriptional activator SoxR
VSETLPIGEVARRAGLRTSAIRYYEEIGLLPEAERQGGRRIYGTDVLDRLAAVRLAQRAGFSLAETRTLLSGFSEDVAPGERWRQMAKRKLPEIEEQMRRAEQMRDLLLRGMDCRCLTLAECGLAAAEPLPRSEL